MVCVFHTLFHDLLTLFRIGDQTDYYYQQEPDRSGPSALRRQSGNYADPAQSQGFDDRRTSSQLHGQSHPRSPDFPTPGTARQAIRSQTLENKNAPKENGPQRETLVQIEPSDTMTEAFGVHGSSSAGLPDRRERSADERNRERGDIQRQQREVIQGGPTNGSQPGPGLNPMIANLVMMGMNPMTGGPQQVFAAQQQVAAQAYQWAMMSFAQNMGQSQAGGDGLGGMGGMIGGMGGMGGPRMLSPMMAGQFDPRMPMMRMPTMGMMGMGMDMGMDLGPVRPMMTEESEMGPGVGGMGGRMGTGTGSGGGSVR